MKSRIHSAQILKMALAIALGALLIVAIAESKPLAQEACSAATAGAPLTAENAAIAQHAILPPASPKFRAILAGALLAVPFGLSTVRLSSGNRAVTWLRALQDTGLAR